MILKLQSWFLFNSLFVCTSYDIINTKTIFPDSQNYIDKTNDIEDFNVIRLFKKLSPYSKNTKKILIKRVVPHGDPASSLEYDNKYKTLYKPFVRIHTKKLIRNDKGKKEDDTYNNNLNPNDLKEPVLEHFVLKETDSTEDLLEPFQSNDYNKINFKILNNIHEPVKSMDLQNDRHKKYNNVIYLLKDILRSPQFEKSGETNDPLAPGRLVAEFDEIEQGEQNSKVWMPHYPPWNYWTYKKPIHQDICPGMQVKVGNMCIWIPPH